MKAAVFREVNQHMDVEEIDIAKPGPREVLVRTVAAGVCHSDMHFFNGTYPGQLPVVLGHESAGIVERTNRSARAEFWNLYDGPLTVEHVAPRLSRYEFFFNYQRPHAWLAYRTPNEFLVEQEAA